jgi:hypothetical protein
MEQREKDASVRAPPRNFHHARRWRFDFEGNGVATLRYNWENGSRGVTKVKMGGTTARSVRRFLVHIRSLGRLLTLVSMALSILAVAVLASGCEEDQRAIPPGVVRQSPTAIPDQEVSDSQGMGGIRDDDATGMTLPNALWVYFTHGGDVWRLPINGDPEPVIQTQSVVAVSPSALGDRLAAITVQPGDESDEERTVFSILDPDGSVALEIENVQEHLDEFDLDWIEDLALAPAGDVLALSHSSGAISVITMTGEIQVVIAPESGPQPGTLQWSADGNFLAYLDPWMPNQPSSLYVAVPESGVRQVMAHAARNQYGVISAAWVPGTTYLAYVASSGSTIPHGGDLFLVDILDGERTLLLSSGSFAPVAGLVDIAVSPHGRQLAATIYVPGDQRPAFHSLYLIDTITGEREIVPVERNHAVTDLWWLGGKLVYRAIDEPRTARPGLYTGLEAYILVEYDPETGETRQRHAYP